MEADRITIKLFCISILLIFLTENLASIILKNSKSPMMILGIARVLEICLIFIVLKFHGGLAVIGLGSSQIWSGFKKGIIWSLGFGIAVGLSFAILFMLNINPVKLLHIRLPKNFVECFVFFLVGGLIGPVAEEIFFRGIMYGFFRQWGIISAICLSTLIFVLLHSSFGLTQIIGGILFALSYEIEGTLMTPVTIHVIGNITLFMLSFFPY